ncbi:hypothetical protein Agub_g5925, partial [Astrephomene gubernaculifera]
PGGGPVARESQVAEVTLEVDKHGYLSVAAEMLVTTEKRRFNVGNVGYVVPKRLKKNLQDPCPLEEKEKAKITQANESEEDLLITDKLFRVLDLLHRKKNGKPLFPPA